MHNLERTLGRGTIFKKRVTTKKRKIRKKDKRTPSPDGAKIDNFSDLGPDGSIVSGEDGPDTDRALKKQKSELLESPELKEQTKNESKINSRVDSFNLSGVGTWVSKDVKVSNSGKYCRRIKNFCKRNNTYFCCLLVIFVGIIWWYFTRTKLPELVDRDYTPKPEEFTWYDEYIAN